MSTKGKTIYLRYLFLVFFLFLLFPGWFFQMPQAGQDSSRDIAIHLARKYHLVFGKDIRLPYGPLGILHSRLPIAVNILTYLFFDIYFMVTLFFILRKIMADHFHYAVIGFLVLAIGVTMRQGMDDWFFFFELFYLFSFLRSPLKRTYLLAAAFPAAAGLFFRVDIGLFGAVIFLVTLFYAWLRRSLPLKGCILGSLFFLLSLLVAGWVFHVDWNGYLLTQLQYSGDIADARYQASPIKDGFLTHLAFEIALCMVYCTACLILVAGVRKDWRKRSEEIFICLVSTLSVFFYFKTGFVRVDDALWRFFSVSVWLAALLYQFGPTDGWRKVPVLCCWIILAICGLAFIVGKKPEVPFAGIGNGSFFRTRAKEIKRYLAGIGIYSGIAVDLDTKTGGPNGLKDLTGSQTADILPWEVSTLYFNGLKYSPRPGVQSFYSYNSWMDSLNYSRYLSPEAPGYVLLSFDAAEHHFAFFDEPRTKLALLNNYDPVTESGNDLILKNMRRYRMIAGGESSANVRLDEDIDVPPNDALQYSRFFISYDSRGRWSRLLDQPPALRITMTLSDGSMHTYRITKPVLEDGVILNKFVDGKEEFQLLMQGQGRLTPDIRKIRIRTDSAGQGFIPNVRMVNSYYRFRQRTPEERVADSLGIASLFQRHSPKPADVRTYKQGNVRAWVDQFDTSSQLIKMRAWAFNDTADNKDMEVSPVFRSRDHFFVLPATTQPRPDLVSNLKREDIADAGVTSVTARPLVPPGDYELGLGVGRKGDSTRPTFYTGRHLLIRSNYSIKASGPVAPITEGNAVMKVNLERAVIWKGQVYFDGWAYLLTGDSGRRQTTIVLSGRTRTYRISTDAVQRTDVAASLKRPSAAYAGFSVSIPENKLAKDVYTVGVEQTQGGNKAIMFSVLLRTGVNDVIVPAPAPPLPPIHDLLSGVDHFDDQKEFFTIVGWAIRDMKEVANSQIDLVLYKDKTFYYVTRTDHDKRKDLTAHFNNGLNLDNSGFSAKVSKESLPPGKYQLGVWVHSKDNVGSVKLLAVFTVKQ